MSTTHEEAVAIRWVPADRDYQLALENGKLVCRNPKGKQLASVPKWLKETELAMQLTALRDWLGQHEQESFETVQEWMLRSLPVPRSVLSEVWDDPVWQSCLNNLVICAVDSKGARDQDTVGFLRDVDAKKGLGIVDLDGETRWIKTNNLAIPHPILLEELADFRDLAHELNLEQKVSQLYRQTWQADSEAAEKTVIDEFARGKFEQLNHALSLCRRLGYRVKGGNAICPIWEDGRYVEARYWVGVDYPEEETWTGSLIFTNEKEHSIAISEVGPVAFSEGMRMAAGIYAKRVVKEEDDE